MGISFSKISKNIKNNIFVIYKTVTTHGRVGEGEKEHTGTGKNTGNISINYWLISNINLENSNSER